MARLLHDAGAESTQNETVQFNAPSLMEEARGPGLKSALPAVGAVSTEAKVESPDADQVGVDAEQDAKRNDLLEDEDYPGDPPFTTLDYTIPEDAFRAARLATPGTPESFWSYTLYRGPSENGAQDSKVKVHYCRSKHTTERVCQYFLKEKVIGFDLEWMADATKWHGARRNICLAQIASQSRIALFHISVYPKNDALVAPSFKKIMEDPEITKVGVFIKGDCTRLRNFLDIAARGIFELSHLYKLVKYSKTGQVQLINRKLVSLATQVQEHLHLPMFKGQDVRSSDWSQPLQMDQIIYSASDAYAAVQLFAILEHQRESLSPTPPRPYHAELGLPIRLAGGVTIPAPEETAEEVEVKGGDKIPTVLTPDFVTSATADIQIEAETDAPEPVVSETPKPRKASAATPARPKDGRIIAAEQWLIEYRTNTPKLRAAPAALRAYHIWHRNGDLEPVAIAKLLREPPLQTNTVVSYILEAIKLEKLPFEKLRLRKEVLDLLPKQVLDMRYKSLVKACESGQTATSS